MSFLEERYTSAVRRIQWSQQTEPTDQPIDRRTDHIWVNVSLILGLSLFNRNPLTFKPTNRPATPEGVGLKFVCRGGSHNGKNHSAPFANFDDFIWLLTFSTSTKIILGFSSFQLTSSSKIKLQSSKLFICRVHLFLISIHDSSNSEFFM